MSKNYKWSNGEVVTAEKMNRIYTGEVTDTNHIFEIKDEADNVAFAINSDGHIITKSFNSSKIIQSSNSSSTAAVRYPHYSTIGSPHIYTCPIDTNGIEIFANTAAIYEAFDALAAAHPRMFKDNGSLGKDASGQFDIKHYTLGFQNPKITSDRNGTQTNQWSETAIPRRRIFINGNIHSWIERHCCYGLYLLCKDILESTEPWAMFIKNNIVLEIVPQPNPWGYDNKTNVNSKGLNLNRTYLTNIQPENQCLITLIESFIPKGLVGVIDLHNTGDSNPGYGIGKPSQPHWAFNNRLVTQLEPIVHDMYKEAYGSDRTVFYHMWNYEGQSGINGLMHDYAEGKNLLCFTLEVATSLAEKGCLLTKALTANVINAMATYEGN